MIQSVLDKKYSKCLVWLQHGNAAKVELTNFEWFCAGFLIYIENLQKAILTNRQ